MSDATQTATTTHLGTDTPGAATTATGTTAAAPAVDATTAKPEDTTAAAKPEGDKPAGEAKPDDKKADDKPAGAPEKYADFTLPEGVTLDDKVMGSFSELAKKHGLTQEAAQEFVSLGAQMQTGNGEAFKAAVEAQGEKWGSDSKADKEFGGDAFDANLATAKRALDQFGTPELKTLLVQSKLGNHPEVLRFFFRAGKAISEDGFVPGRSGQSGKSLAQQMYPNMNP